MDDIVKQALIKWPHVPNCYGWLGLDARGNWHMRDEQTQRLGPFPLINTPSTPGARGSRLEHEKLIDFIHRNYEQDELGQWFFQNGPQRVYVELEATPYIWRVRLNENRICVTTAHTGQVTEAQHCLVDELGHVYLVTDLGFGLVHTQDVAVMADAIDLGLWTPEDVVFNTLDTRFGYVHHPKKMLRQCR